MSPAVFQCLQPVLVCSPTTIHSHEIETLFDVNQVTNKPRFSLVFLATLRLTFAHPCATAATQAPPNDAPTLSTRSPASESPVKTLTSDQKPRFCHPLT